VVFPSEQVLQNTRSDKISSNILVGLELDLDDVFEDTLNLED
jgi:hypothetical protein